MKIVDEYKRSDGGSVTLATDGTHWEVSSWNADDECHWTVRGQNHGGTSDGFRTVGATFVPFDEAAARVEFERWRS